jgi:hypothetical protein
MGNESFRLRVLAGPDTGRELVSNVGGSQPVAIGREVNPPLATFVVREACAALSYVQLQEPGFVHRNLKLWTIMVGFDGQVVLSHDSRPMTISWG